MDSSFPEMYGCPEHWQSEAMFEAFVDVSGLVLNVAALVPVGTRAATYSGGGLHIFEVCGRSWRCQVVETNHSAPWSGSLQPASSECTTRRRRSVSSAIQGCCV